MPRATGRLLQSVITEMGGRLTFADGLPAGWFEGGDTMGLLAPLFGEARLVYNENACALQGVPIKFDPFSALLDRAVQMGGYVDPIKAKFVMEGLRWGFEAGIQRHLLKGQKVFKNYESATGEYEDKVAKAMQKRVSKRKSIDVGEWIPSYKKILKDVFGDFSVAPMSAVAKPLEPNECRPCTDHRRTGTNEATIIDSVLQHQLKAHQEIAYFLKKGYVMHVTDVESAFEMLPLAPWLWPFFGTRFKEYDSASGRAVGRERLRFNVCGDFGTKGMPGTFKAFFVDVVIGMARAFSVLTHPMPTHVDDNGLIGSVQSRVRGEMQRFQAWSTALLGVNFKEIKDRSAAQHQLMLGFWWDSFARTLTLDEAKLRSYINQLLECSDRHKLTLEERQSLAGRMQRAVLTLPPGAACLLANTYAMMSGLNRPWQARRTTVEERGEFRFFADVLSLNLGQGYFSTDHFSEGPGVLSDASKSREYSGGGYVSACGFFDFFEYGSRAARRLIDELEGDTAVEAVRMLAEGWGGRWIPFGVDNSAFERSAARGRSSAARLNQLVKRLLVLQITNNCIVRWYWLSTHDNYLSDHLSRGRLKAFLQVIMGAGFLLAGVSLRRHPRAGRIHRFSEDAPITQDDRARIASRAQDRVDHVDYSRKLSAAVKIQSAVKGFLARHTRFVRLGGVGLGNTRTRGPSSARLVRYVLLFMKLSMGMARPMTEGSGVGDCVRNQTFVHAFARSGVMMGDRTFQSEIRPPIRSFLDELHGLSPVHVLPCTPWEVCESKEGYDACCSLLMFVSSILVVCGLTHLLMPTWPPRGFVCTDCRSRPCECPRPDSPTEDDDDELWSSDESEGGTSIMSMPSAGRLRGWDREDLPELVPLHSLPMPSPSPSDRPAAQHQLMLGVWVDSFASPSDRLAAFGAHSLRIGGATAAAAAGSEEIPGVVEVETVTVLAAEDDTPAEDVIHIDDSQVFEYGQFLAVNLPTYADDREAEVENVEPTPPRIAGRPRRAGVFRLLIMSIMLGTGMAAPEGLLPGRMDASTFFSRTDLFKGLRGDMITRVDQVLDNRLAPSSMRSVNAAMTHWRDVCEAFGWHTIIFTDDEERGGKLAAMWIWLMDQRTDLTFDTINNYVWGMRTWQKLQHQADPVLGVLGYTDFVKGIKVLTYVQHEPRRMLPYDLLLKVLKSIDESVFWEVNIGLLLVTLFFSFSRSENGCPKAFTGPESFDKKKHWMVRDFVVTMIDQAGWAMKILMKSNKTDPRLERPEARGDGSDPHASKRGGADWLYVGDVPDSILSIFKWYRRLMSFFGGPRDPSSPMFLSRDQVRPLTYTGAMGDFHKLLRRVTDDIGYGLHGLRVLGYNCSKEANGEDLTVAHGGWKSTAHKRYARFPNRLVLGMASRMAGMEDPYDQMPRPRQVVYNRQLAQRGGPHSSDEELEASPAIARRDRLRTEPAPRAGDSAPPEEGGDDHPQLHSQEGEDFVDRPLTMNDVMPPFEHYIIDGGDSSDGSSSNSSEPAITRTHSRDLDLVSPAVTRARAKAGPSSLAAGSSAPTSGGMGCGPPPQSRGGGRGRRIFPTNGKAPMAAPTESSC